MRWQIKDRSIKDDLGDKADKEVPEKSKLKFLGILSAWQMTNRLTQACRKGEARGGGALCVERVFTRTFLSPP